MSSVVVYFLFSFSSKFSYILFNTWILSYETLKFPTAPPMALWVGKKLLPSHLVFSETTLILAGEWFLVMASRVNVMALFAASADGVVFFLWLVGKLSKATVLLDCSCCGPLARERRLFLEMMMIFMSVPVGFSKSLAPLALSLGYMRQKKTQGAHYHFVT